VVAADPGSLFSFEVTVVVVPASRWTYEFQPEGNTTLVTETWTDRRPTWFARLAGVTMGIGDIRSHNERNMTVTLQKLAAVAERPT
jgi:hypothetical protein